VQSWSGQKMPGMF